MQQFPSIPAPSQDATEEPIISSPENRSSGLKSVLSTIGILVAAPLVALLLTAFVFQSYEVDGPSMETTLQNSDRLIVWKMPKTIAKLTRNAYIPKRSDVIVFVKPELHETGGQEKQLIKRVVGLPGDRVVVQDGHITIYNTEHPDGYNPDSNHDFSQNIASLTTGNVDLVVPEGHVFVCGDNRTNSLDSRSFGPVSSDDIVGKLTMRIFPVSKFKSFL